ncbi:fimbrial protein [Serratia marcescens]|uniref:fimbrial protein n=1 Tax=Serratia marcescens TaxID=615 RepID=UPI0011E6EC17|nr:fimbrial protein [Serratia marcescens]
MGRELGAILLLALTVIPGSGPRADTDIYFSGTVTAPMPCVINGKQTIETHFGDDLITTRVDGNNYLKELSYTLVCNGNSKNALRMKVQGDATGFNQHALQTSLRDLGVELRANGQPLAINAWFSFTYPDKPTLQAVPVKRVGQGLPAGTFSVNAAMLVDYQ